MYPTIAKHLIYLAGDKPRLTNVFGRDSSRIIIEKLLPCGDE